jgi:hypothetical protein
VLPLPNLGSCREYPSAFLRFSAYLTVWNASGVRITTNASQQEEPGVLYGDGPVWWERRTSKALTRDPGALLHALEPRILAARDFEQARRAESSNCSCSAPLYATLSADRHGLSAPGGTGLRGP